jgi:hypothetical protein
MRVKIKNLRVKAKENWKEIASVLVYTEEIGNLVHDFTDTCIINGGQESVLQLNIIGML